MRFLRGQFRFIVTKCSDVQVENKKHFIFAIKKNRLVALSLEDKLLGQFKSLESLDLRENEVTRCFLKGMEQEVLVTRQIFTNQDGSMGVLYLATSDTSLDFSQMTAIYQKRWNKVRY